jgi:hypothetical protein
MVQKQFFIFIKDKKDLFEDYYRDQKEYFFFGENKQTFSKSF